MALSNGNGGLRCARAESGAKDRCTRKSGEASYGHDSIISMASSKAAPIYSHGSIMHRCTTAFARNSSREDRRAASILARESGGFWGDFRILGAACVKDERWDHLRTNAHENRPGQLCGICSLGAGWQKRTVHGVRGSPACPPTGGGRLHLAVLHGCGACTAGASLSLTQLTVPTIGRSPAPELSAGPVLQEESE